MTPLLLAALLAEMLVALACGPLDISLAEIAKTVCSLGASGEVPAAVRNIIWEAMLPRVLGAVLVGAALSMAGLASQTLFRNPLATPYVIGISSGAAVGAVVSMLISGGAAILSIFPMSVTGGVLAAFANHALSSSSDPSRSGRALLLNGIAINAFCSAIISLALFMSNERLQTLVFWLMGGLWKLSWDGVAVLFPLTAAFLVLLRWHAKAMNLTLMGERQASDLGVNVGLLQKTLLVALAVMVSVAVSLTGLIGFIGLIVPHMMRLILGPGHERLLPASAIAGGILLLSADLLAKSLAFPSEIPVGVLTAAIGAPVFICLLSANGGGR